MNNVLSTNHTTLIVCSLVSEFLWKIRIQVLFVLVVVGGGGGGGGYAGKVVDLERMTKNPNLVFFLFFGGRGWAWWDGRESQDRARGNS